MRSCRLGSFAWCARKLVGWMAAESNAFTGLPAREAPRTMVGIVCFKSVLDVVDRHCWANFQKVRNCVSDPATWPQMFLRAVFARCIYSAQISTWSPFLDSATFPFEIAQLEPLSATNHDQVIPIATLTISCTAGHKNISDNGAAHVATTSMLLKLTYLIY